MLSYLKRHALQLSKTSESLHIFFRAALLQAVLALQWRLHYGVNMRSLWTTFTILKDPCRLCFDASILASLHIDTGFRIRKVTDWWQDKATSAKLTLINLINFQILVLLRVPAFWFSLEGCPPRHRSLQPPNMQNTEHALQDLPGEELNNWIKQRSSVWSCMCVKGEAKGWSNTQW